MLTNKEKIEGNLQFAMLRASESLVEIMAMVDGKHLDASFRASQHDKLVEQALVMVRLIESIKYMAGEEETFCCKPLEIKEE